MLRAKIVAIVKNCARYGWTVIAVAIVVTLATGYYSARNFTINTDINKLISTDLPWRQREIVVSTTFVDRNSMILAVVNAPTSELASQASAALTERLKAQTDKFTSVNEPAEHPFFTHNGLLFLPTDQVDQWASQFGQIQPLLRVLATDQSLRGLVQALTFGLAGVQRQMFTLDAMTRPLTMVSATLEDVVAGKPASFSWRALASGKDPEPSDRRRILEIKPILDYNALEPGQAATSAIRQTAAELGFATEYQAQVRLTGAIPIQDEEFSTLKENADINAAVSLAFLVGILWLALRSGRIITAVLMSIFVGLAITAALGLLMVGSFNPISIAFAVLFVGIGVDFGIQFSVRYRAERYDNNNLRVALVNAARHVGVPLTLAAAATAAGFMSFLPTHYKGVSELGQIAGVGMIIAFLVSITLLPALLSLFNPPGEKEPLGYKSLAPLDHFLERHRIPIIVATALISIGGLPLLYFLQFDFNPMNLRSPKVESVATYLELRRDPAAGASAVDVVTPSLAAARETAERLKQLPEVARTMTLDSFIPPEQPQKLARIAEVKKALEPAFSAPPRPAPTDAENIAALKRGAEALTNAAGTETGTGAAAAKRLAAVMTQVADGDETLRKRAEVVFVSPLKTALAGLRDSLDPHEINEDNIPPEIARQWLAADGRARIEVHPKGDPADTDVLRQFARAVLAVEPRASGGPISIYETGNTVVRAFIEAGICAFVSIALLLWIVLRRLTDVWLTLIPLLLAGVVSLEICVLIGLKLNFANIIALPLLLGVGVAFKIYYITAWREGQTELLQSPLTRAVLYSAMTTATAFGSLWLSSHPGTSSMGKLLALSLVCTLAAAVLFQPLLMGPPRDVRDA